MPPVVLVHVVAGLTGVMAGFAALLLRKGSASHRRLGNLFTVAMLAMGLSGAYRAAFVHVQPINVVAGLFTTYLVASGWLAARRAVARFDVATAGIALAGGVFGLASLGYATSALHGASDPAATLGAFVFGGLVLLGVSGDVRLLTRGPLTGNARVRRHLWRVGLAMLLATVSLFVGTPNRILPTVVSGTALQWLPVGAVIVLLCFGRWKWRAHPAERRAVTNVTDAARLLS